jgi:2-dehydro-3-deoxygalactonokinase
LRLTLFESGQAADTRESPGIGRLVKPPSETLLESLDPWVNGHEQLEVVLGGMASSRNGLLELPYVRAPASVEDWLRLARRVSIGPLNVLVATGVQFSDELGESDVMRGEEAQIFGALEINPALRRAHATLVLPGTHTKWVTLAEGLVSRFSTAITGEMYGLLRDYSSLLTAQPHQLADAADFDRGFSQGVDFSLRVDGNLLWALFKVRTAQLVDGRRRSWASGFLSGLLIGTEVVAMNQADELTLVGEPSLVELYRRVLVGLGINVSSLDGGACALRGLSLIREFYR